MSTIDWTARGIVWMEEEVSEQTGDHATDRRVLGKAQMPVVKDLNAFVAEYGEGAVLGSLDGTSIRVMAQDVNRTGLRKRLTADEIKLRIDGRLRGIRSRAIANVVTKEVTVYPLPGGATYKGTDNTEYQQAYIAALVDLGTPADVAMTIASSMTITPK
jgi:hypothetical protein